MNNELLEALTILEQEKNISKETLLEAIENSLLTACKNHFGKADNIKVNIDPETCEFHVLAEKTVVEKVEDDVTEISLANARMIDSEYNLGDVVNVEVKSKEFGRIATQNAKNVILQKIREEERKAIYSEYYSMEKDVVTGIVQRYVGKNISINLGKADAILTENEQVKGEVFKPTERIKVYILEVKSTPKGPKIMVSRTHPELVKREYEEGHYIANHGYNHNNKILYKNMDSFKNEIISTDAEISKAIGVDNYCSHIFRFPNGYMSHIYTSQKKDALGVLSSLNYVYVDWNCLNRDSEKKYSDYQLLNNLKKTSKNKGTLIILMHDTADVNKTYTVLKSSISYLKSQGYEFRNFYDLINNQF